MRATTTSLTNAIVAQSRVIDARVSCDWDNDGYNGDYTVDDMSPALSSLDITQVLTSNVPSAAQPIVGSAVAQLDVDLDQGHVTSPASAPFIRGITTTQISDPTTGLITVNRPAVQPGDLVLLWLPNASKSYYVRSNGTNVSWNQLMFRGDFNATQSRITMGRLLTRRISTDRVIAAAEPSSYTFNVQYAASTVAICAVIGGAYAPGIHVYSTKGSEVSMIARNVVPTVLYGTPLTTTLDKCLILGFFAGWAAQSTPGVTWTPSAPATELADVCSLSTTMDNVTACLTQITNAPPGKYILGAAQSTPQEPGVVAAIALSPLNAGDLSQNASWVYSELNANSPIAGKRRDYIPVTAKLAFATSAGREEINIFTGRALRIDVSSRSRSATFTALDNRELMRGDPTQLNQFASSIIAENPFTDNVGNYIMPGLEATWIVSYIFTWCRKSTSGNNLSEGPLAGDGFFASPPQRPSCVLHAPLHGSAQPFNERANMHFAYVLNADNTYSRLSFVDGPWVASTSPAPIGGTTTMQWDCDNVYSMWTDSAPGASSTIGRIEAYVKQSVTNTGMIRLQCLSRAGSGPSNTFTVGVDGGMQLQILMDAYNIIVVSPINVPQDQQWHAVGVHWNAITGQAIFDLDGTHSTVAFTAFNNAATSNDGSQGSWAYLQMWGGAQAAEVQFSGGFTGNNAFAYTDVVSATDSFIGEGFTPTAFIDKSENILDALPDFDSGDDMWDVVTQLAEAEFAYAYFDVNGYPHYRTRASDVSSVGQSVVRTLRTVDSIKDVDYQSGIDQLMNYVTTPYTPPAIKTKDVLWQADTVYRVPASGNVQITTKFAGLPVDLAPTVTYSYAANTASDGSGTNVVVGVGLGYQINRRQVIVTLYNSNTYPVYYVDTSGSPSASITGAYVSSGSAVNGTTYQDDESIRRHGVQFPPTGISESKWRQRSDVANTISQLLIADLANPRPILTNIKVVGDPRLELGDLVRFQDPDGLGLDGNYRIVGISPSYSPNDGFTQTLVARFSGCGVAIWDSSYWDDCSVWGA